MKLHEMRKEYSEEILKKSSLKKNPLDQFKEWFHEASNEDKVQEANAFVLSTIHLNQFPSSRTVLLKSFNDNGFIFYTNYQSKKAKDIANNNNVSLLFLWIPLNKQIQICGKATKISSEESSIYFKSRPRQSQISAWASQQSEIVINRRSIDKRFNYFSNKFKHSDIECPENWGGFLIKPFYFEFWKGRDKRLHDRFQYTLNNNKWTIHRIAS